MSLDYAIVITPDGTLELTADEYTIKFGHNAEGNRIICHHCHEPVIIMAMSSVRREPYLKHKNSDENSDCPYLERNEYRFKHLNTRRLDQNQVARLREEFYQDENIKRAYEFMGRICGINNFTITDFNNCMKIANSKNIWAYSGIQQWVIPYILLTLGIFKTQPKAGESSKFRFILEKPSEYLDDTWLTPEKCKLAKIFDKTKSSDKTIRYMFPTKDFTNPMPMSKESYMKESKNINWINDKTLADLKKTA